VILTNTTRMSHLKILFFFIFYVYVSVKLTPGFRKNELKTKYVLTSSTRLSDTFFFPRRTERDMIKNVNFSSRNINLYCQIVTKLEFYGQIFDKNRVQNFKNKCPFGSKVFQDDGRTDMTKLIVNFHNFAKTCIKEKQ
jgi:hypothetical protein